jgi:hypothetical protein
VTAAIDFTDVGGLAALPLNVELNARVERAAAAAMALPRMYLGASIAGDECARAIQYAWWTVPDLPARVKLVFDRGHALEALARAQLLQAGFLFAPPEALAFVALDGYLQGHADGIIIAGPAMPGVYFALPTIWEAKCLNAKNWRAVVKDGLAKVFPKYATQVALYQHFLDKPNPALITCVNADTREVLHFHPAVRPTARARDRRARGGDHRRDPQRELLPRFTNDPKNWKCGICPHKTRCWGTP